MLGVEPVADCHRAVLGLFLADDQHVRDQLELRVADLAVDLGAPQVDRDPEAGGLKLLLDVGRIAIHLLADRQDADLLRGQPQRKRRGEVLYQHPHEPLHAAERRPMHHDRAMGLVVGADVFKLEPLGQVIVKLHRSQLPLAADAVADHEVGLGAIKRGFAQARLEGQFHVFQHMPQRRLGPLPVLFAADVLVAFGIAQRQLHAVIVEPQRPQHELHQFDGLAELVLDLIGSAKLMGVVLRQAADAQHAVQLSRLFVPVHRSELGQPYRQVAIAPLLRLINLDVMRAVHRLQEIPLLVRLPVTQSGDFLVLRALHGIVGNVAFQLGRELDEFFFLLGGQLFRFEFRQPAVDNRPGRVSEDRRELRITVIRKMSAGFVHFHTADVRRINRLISPLEQLDLDEVFQNASHRGPLGQPQAQSRADVIADMEQGMLLAQHAMVAAFGLFDLRQMGAEVFLMEERGGVQALQRSARGIPLEVRRGNRQQFEGLNLARVGNMRSTAQIDEFTLPVKAERDVIGQPRLEVFDLEMLLEIGAKRHGLVAR